ncbi:FAD-dependent oxidoreductase [Umezawaea sp. Da 62-37]|uniref:flavin-containing monooxygenase n=1 Tax=Umezawaea sp. Da 62-37 TaxID=3075927 RepID=UPI0028F73ECF|nr:FAD-dependent oxidoreductase [Umezawaea sp. Da 62-37]WNV88833.1 FAD-dependent oxidoreductase [Umezawaea sp. Da 62-37]
MTKEKESQYSEQPIVDHVCVIGAGISGLAVARTLRRRNVSFVCVDRTGGVGGIWRQPSTGEPWPGYRSLHLNTSQKITAFADVPMPTDYPLHPRHDQIRDYLASYAEAHDLIGHMEFDTDVVSVERQKNSTWEVVTVDRATGLEKRRTFGHVVVATGHQWDPVRPGPDIPGFDSFPGEQLHAIDYSTPFEHLDKRVAVVGFGNSAADLSVELSRLAKKTILSFRRSLHVVPKTLMGIPIDEIATSRWWGRMTFTEQQRFIKLLLRIIRGKLTDFGIPKPDHKLFAGPLTISDELLSRISHGDIVVKPAIKRFDGSTVRFADGTSEEVDTVIYCTGYRISFPFLPADCAFTSTGRVGLYQRVVAPRHTGLYFAGLLKPVGSITRLVEMQAKWIADLVQGKAVLPPADVMEAEVEKHLSETAGRYGTTAQDSIQVDVTPYLDAIKRERTRHSHVRMPERA